MPWLRRSTLFLPVLYAAALLTCIERNNPWDPVNGCPEEIKSDIRNQQRAAIDSAVSRINKAGEHVGFYDSLLNALYDSNLLVAAGNQLVLHAIDSVDDANNQISAHNRQAVNCDSLQLKKRYEQIRYFGLYDSLSSAKAALSAVRIDSLTLAGVITDGNERCLPQNVYSRAFTDSVFFPIDSISRIWDRLVDSATNLNQSMNLTNALTIDSTNRAIARALESVERYNDSITFVSRFCGRSLIAGGDSLEKRTASAVSGDTLVLNAGTFRASVRFNNSGTSLDPIVIQGAPGDQTILDSSDLFLSSKEHIRFRNIVFSRSQFSGVKLESNSRAIYFENCVFRQNGLHGLEVIDSDVHLQNCRIYANSGSGIRITSGSKGSNVFTLENILIARNLLYGIDALTASGSVSFATISNNGIDGVRMQVASRPVSISNALVTFNAQYGLRHVSDIMNGDLLRLANVNIYGNSLAPMLADSLYLNASITFHDPRYRDQQKYDYRIGPESELYGAFMIGYREY